MVWISRREQIRIGGMRKRIIWLGRWNVRWGSFLSVRIGGDLMIARGGWRVWLLDWDVSAVFIFQPYPQTNFLFLQFWRLSGAFAVLGFIWTGNFLTVANPCSTAKTSHTSTNPFSSAVCSPLLPQLFSTTLPLHHPITYLPLPPNDIAFHTLLFKHDPHKTLKHDSSPESL